MKFYNYFKYFFRFITLQVFLTALTIWYFDNFLIGNYFEGFIIIRDNLLQDRDRFYPFISNDFIKIDFYLGFFVFVFLVLLYLSKFYSYVNELTFTANKSLFDEFLSIYLIWTASYLSFFQIFRFDSVSRAYLLLYTFIVPIFLVAFRNSEFISSILGRNPTKENFISFNLEKDSIYRELRLLTFRNNLAEYKSINKTDFAYYKKTIESFNKENEINLIVFDLSGVTSVPSDFEKYLLNLNKKVLFITELDFKFNSQLIFRNEIVSSKSVFYINNDIQYGSKYISKRILDLITITIFSILFIPISVLTSIYIFLLDGYPMVIKQTRVGLHGRNFTMYKFRTMKNNSHNERKDLEKQNEHSGPLFKIDDDPRIIKGSKVLRKFSLDELPQLVNVLKGDMSMVGPRPLFPEDNSHFDENYIRRLNVLPGVTGLLQINERNTDDFNVWYKYDLEYIENWSILLDIKIILRTPIALLKSKIIGK
jgi:lipopolysaccharide/colanic/teichoic acid biosynthesis glycosyltransferase